MNRGVAATVRGESPLCLAASSNSDDGESSDSDLPRAVGRPPRQFERACTLLAAALAYGPQPVGRVDDLLDRAGISVRTRWRARRALGVVAFYRGGQARVALPDPPLRTGGVLTPRLPWESEDDQAERHRAGVGGIGGGGMTDRAIAEHVLAVGPLEALDLGGCAWIDRLRTSQRVRKARRELDRATVEQLRDSGVGNYLADVCEQRAS